MFKKSIFISLSIFFILMIFTSIVKNKTRNIEKNIHILSHNVSILEKELENVKIDFIYLSSPEKLKKSSSTFNHLEYTSYDFSRIFLSTNDFENHATKEVKHLKRKK